MDLDDWSDVQIFEIKTTKGAVLGRAKKVCSVFSHQCWYKKCLRDF